MKRIFLPLLLGLWALPAWAGGSLLTGATNPCSPTSCTGAYFGAFLAGNGTNADVVGNGLTGSVFSGGGMPGITAGYQFANGTYFAAAEAGIGYEVNVATSLNGQTSNATGLFAYEIIKAGGQLGGLLGQTTGISIPGQLTQQLISPYILVGAVERQFGQGWATGAGATFDITPKLFLDLSYMYVDYGAGATIGAVKVTNENWIRVGLDYKLNF
jgi:opacity protein-like surface antigen